MPGWHMRLWRRVRVAPGVTVNFSKSGASLSLGPRGAKVTVGRRGIRQTVGLPGTGLYATRQLSPRPPVVDGAPRPAGPPRGREAALEVAPYASAVVPDASADGLAASTAAPDAAAADDDQVVLYFGFATVVGVLFGVALALIGLPSGQAFTGGALAVVTGIAYEGLAHHHPGPARALAAVIVGAISIATVAVAVLGLGMLAAALAGGSGRSRRRRW